MDVGTLKTKIINKQLDSFMIWTGDEWKVQDIYIQQMVRSLGLETKRIDSISDIYGKLKNRSFVLKPRIYIVRDDKELMTNEKLQQQIQNGLLGDNYLILLLTSVDKRTKFYKAFKASIIVFERLSDSMLKKYVKREIKLSERNTERLIEICEHDYGRCLLEIDKIQRYAKESGEEDKLDHSFEVLLTTGTIHQPPHDAIFDFVGAYLDRKPRLTFDLFEQCKEIGEATMVMLSVMYSNTKALLQVQAHSGADICKSTGLSAWQVKCAKEHLNKYSVDELIYMLQLIQKVEVGIKTGKIEEGNAIEYLLVRTL